MASKEIQNKSLRDFLTEKASKVLLETLQKSRFPWMTNRDVSNGKLKCDPDKRSPTIVKMATESVFFIRAYKAD